MSFQLSEREWVVCLNGLLVSILTIHSLIFLH